jgi:hypothetical protein
MMIGGAIGFYLGINTPPLTFQGSNGQPSKGGPGGKIDATEFLSAVGTFIATLTAFVSVVCFVRTRRSFVGWLVGLMMQIIRCWSNCTHSHLV